MVLIFKSLINSLTKLKILTGERQRGESWALENVLNPTPGSQDQAVCSQSFQTSNIITVQWNPCITASQGEMHFGRYIEVAFAEGFSLV